MKMTSPRCAVKNTVDHNTPYLGKEILVITVMAMLHLKKQIFVILGDLMETAPFSQGRL